MYLVLDEKITQMEQNNIKKYINCRCEGILDNEVKEDEQIQLTSHGKLVWVINKIRRNMKWRSNVKYLS